MPIETSITSNANQTVWTLVGHEGPTKDAGRIVLSELPCRIGRRTEADVCLPYASVSGVHAQFFEKEGELFLEDLRSTNGTFVNGNRIHEPLALAGGELIQFAEAAFRLIAAAQHVTRATNFIEDVCDSALALAQFDRLMSERAVTPFYQPIVDAGANRPIAYEVLGRSNLYGLHNPGQMFQAAAQLNMEAELSRLLRDMGFPTPEGSLAPPHLFLNTHPSELEDTTPLIQSLRQLRKLHPETPITLEIHESAIADIPTMKTLRQALSKLNMTLAYDDFGVGQSRLSEMVEAQPDFVKFDMQLVRGIHQAAPQRRRLVGALVKMVQELGIRALAEGVECKEEEAVCRELGFELFQGYHFGRPACATQYFGAALQSAGASNTIVT